MTDQPSAFDLIRGYGEEFGWSDASQIILLCHFIDQIHDRLPGFEDDGVLGDLARYLSDQAGMEQDASGIVFTSTDIPDLEFETPTALEWVKLKYPGLSYFHQLIMADTLEQADPQMLERRLAREQRELETEMEVPDPTDIYRGGYLYAVGDTPPTDELYEDEED